MLPTEFINTAPLKLKLLSLLPRPASVAKVITKDVPLYLDEIGTCAAYETVQVPAQVSGVIIGRHFQDGSDVKKGDLLFTIDPRPFQAVLDQAKAQAALDQATLKRQEDLRARKVIAQQDYDIAVANAQKSKGAAEAAQVNLDFCFIKSPINGRIGLRNVDVGNLVGPSSPALVTIQGLDPIYTDFTVAENDLPLVRKYLGGPNVKVRNLPCRWFDYAAGRRFVFHRPRSATRLRNGESSWGYAESRSRAMAVRVCARPLHSGHA